MTIQTGGPAFPTNDSTEGMTVRDYVAAAYIPKAAEDEDKHPSGPNGEATYQGIAQRCFNLADAFIAEKNLRDSAI